MRSAEPGPDVEEELLRLRARVAELEQEVARRAAVDGSPDAATLWHALEERARALIANLPGGAVFVVDRDLRYVVAEGEALHRAGLTSAAFLGRHVRETQPRTADYEARYRQALNGEQFSVEHEAYGRLYLTRGTPVRDAAGNIDAALAVSFDITDLRFAEAGMRAAVERYEQQVRIFEGINSTTPDFVYLFDPQGRFLYANRHLLEVWGMELADVVGKTCLELGYEQWHHDMHMREIAEVIRTKCPIKGEVPFKAPMTGIFGIYEYIFTPVLGPDGEVEMIAGTTRDVTDRKRAEEALRDSERRQGFLLRLGDTLRPLADPDEIQFEAARVLGEHLGASRVGYAECVGDNDEIVVARHYTNGVPGVEGRHSLRDYGRTLHADLVAGRTVLRQDIQNDPELSASEKAAFAALPLGAMADFPLVKNGRLVAILFVHYREAHTFSRAELSLMEEVAERTWAAVERAGAEMALKKSEQRIRRLVDSNIIGVATADISGVRTANDLFLQMIGATREDLEAGRVSWNDVTPPEHIEKDLRALEALRTRGWCSPFEKEYLHPDGTRVPVLIGAAALGKEPLEWTCFALDLTERKALEARLREKQKLESIGLLAGGIAHDFNNLLVGIMGNASLAEDMLPPANSVRRIVSEIIKSAERAAHLTQEMLAYSGKGRFLIQRLNLSESVRDIADLIRSSIPSGVTLRFDLSADLPPVEADSAQIQQLVMNLLLNAAEAIGEAKGVITVRTRTRQVEANDLRRPDFEELVQGLYVCLEVRDTGCGMNPETLAKIFDPFFTTKFTGRGLGLAAVSGIVRGHKGAIRVMSTPGQGSVFEVLLPAASVPEPIRIPEQHAQADLHGAGTILVVDDENVVLRIAKGALERQGYAVLVAASGQAALDLIEAGTAHIDLVLLDLSIPGMDGPETFQEIRKILPDVPVLVSSGYSESECLRVFAGAKISGFVPKPYTVKVLAEKVKSVLSGQ